MNKFLKKDSIFQYAAKDCKTEDTCNQALSYYDGIKDQVSAKDLNNYQCVIEALTVRVHKLYKEKNLDPFEGTREFFYKEALILSVEFLQAIPDPVKLKRLYRILLGAMKLSGVEWNAEYMYSDTALFHLAPTKNEKVVQFIHSVLMSGMHTTKQITKLMNMYIKLINVLQLCKKINVDLPSKKTLHNISFAPFLNY